MDDPFSELKQTLESIFHLEPMRNGKYTYPEIQRLKEAIENYQSDEKKTFVELINAIGAALSYFEKWGLNFDSIKNAASPLSKLHQMPDINWDRYLSRTSIFQFSGSTHTPQDVELVDWLTATSGEAFPEEELSTQTRILIDHREYLGFSQKLSTHLEKDPEFLSRLIMGSENNFINISNTRLILYLTDQQLAQAIIHHLPKFVQEHQDPFVQVEQLVDKLNGILSNGRSISTLLRNSEAKSILDSSDLFQIYQSDEYNNREESTSPSPEDQHFKPGT
ncbi:MAG: hypothetical protein HYX60_12115 [Legionella longbeachae]|nr:hypothetical protein [Legionella longbeachae]